MSDTSQGEGWWLASDGKWYPPEATPGPVAPPPPPPTAPPTTAPPVLPESSTPVPPAPNPAVPAAPGEMSPPVWKKPWFIVVVALLLIGVIAAIAAGAADDGEPNADDLSDASEDGGSATESVDGDGDGPTDDGDTPVPSIGSTTGTEVDDVVRCSIVGDDMVELEVVNNSSETSSYFVTVVFRDDTGARLGDELQTVNDLRPGERTIESSFSFDLAGTSCEPVDVDRFSTQPAADELDDANACEITGRDVFDDLEANVSVTNNSSETSDYFMTVAFIRDDGTRVGTGSVSINAVASGETAPGDVFTVVEADASACEVVSVQRFANN